MAATITEGDRPGSYVLWLDGRAQSQLDPDDPTWLGFDYMRRIADVLDAAAPPGEPLRVLHVGGAAMTLPRYVAHTRPRSGQVVLEPDAALVEDVRRLLPLPPRSGIKVRPVDGVAGLPAVRDDAMDVVVLDAFAGGAVPPELLGTAFLGQVTRVLADGGLLVANIADRAPFPLVRRAVAGVREHFAEVLVGAEPPTLKGRREGNLVLVAGAHVPADALHRRAASGAAPYRLFTGTAVRDSFGGAQPLP
ncbi:fused MFS/spermidine synthase [Nocardioides sp. CER19]|uniref:spermidine synthase n=1 Tax=Nocardioides sp. CER19 TaxID=3038538 RepID=UPI00244D32B9|nr:fused MFS/spermidine synthase [Nocardioides sp. CER19]MDH2415606.1 fused MFS/spermidine synthase [Nocardioides sp. CER19]